MVKLSIAKLDPVYKIKNMKHERGSRGPTRSRQDTANGEKLFPEVQLSRVPSLPDLSYEHIRNAIVTQRLAPGQWLRQEEIANELGVSRLPVREALRRLNSEGLVVLKPRRGYYVMSLDPEEILEVFTIRSMLEGQSGFLAARNRSRDDIQLLSEIYGRMEELDTSDPDNYAEFGRLNFQFHDHIHAISGMKHARRILHSLNDIAECYVRVGMSLGSTVRSTQEEHRAILDAFIEGDQEKTRAMCQAHCENTGRRLLEYLKRARPGPQD